MAANSSEGARNTPKRQCLFGNVTSRCDVGLLVHGDDVSMGVGVIAAAEQECRARHAVEGLQGARKTLPQMNDATGDHVGKVVEIVEVLARDDLGMARADRTDVH